jgi:uncharacterized protein YndB with AHSA1/START domain
MTAPSLKPEQTATADREILLSRVIDAPRERVFRALTDPKQVVQWWGPNGFTTTTREMSVRPGGVWRFVMHGPDGRNYENRIRYLEVTEPERIVYQHDGGEDVEPVRFTTIVTFEEHNGKTKITWQAVFESAAQRDWVIEEYGALEGGKQNLARLDEFVTQNKLAERT